ncbi:hypothetical protein ACWDWU_11330 [Streptomyces sp. NPDC003442]
MIDPHESLSRASSTYFSEIRTKGAAAFNTSSTLPVSDFLQQRVRGGAARNQTQYASEKFDALLERARTTRDERDRTSRRAAWTRRSRTPWAVRCGRSRTTARACCCSPTTSSWYGRRPTGSSCWNTAGPWTTGRQ